MFMKHSYLAVLIGIVIFLIGIEIVLIYNVCTTQAEKDITPNYQEENKTNTIPDVTLMTTMSPTKSISPTTEETITANGTMSSTELKTTTMQSTQHVSNVTYSPSLDTSSPYSTVSTTLVTNLTTSTVTASKIPSAISTTSWSPSIVTTEVTNITAETHVTEQSSFTTATTTPSPSFPPPTAPSSPTSLSFPPTFPPRTSFSTFPPRTLHPTFPPPTFLPPTIPPTFSPSFPPTLPPRTSLPTFPPRTLPPTFPPPTFLPPTFLPPTFPPSTSPLPTFPPFPSTCPPTFPPPTFPPRTLPTPTFPLPPTITDSTTAKTTSSISTDRYFNITTEVTTEKNTPCLTKIIPKFNYVLKDAKKGVTCVLANMTIHINLQHTTKDSQVKSALTVPINATTTGICDEKTANMSLSWEEALKNQIGSDKKNYITFNYIHDNITFSLDSILVDVHLNEVFKGNTTDRHLQLFSAAVKHGIFICKRDTTINVGDKIEVVISDIYLIVFHECFNDINTMIETNCIIEKDIKITVIIGIVIVGIILVFFVFYLICYTYHIRYLQRKTSKTL